MNAVAVVTPATPVPPIVKIDPAQTRLALELKQAVPLMASRFDPSGQNVFASAHDSTLLRYQIATGKKTVLEGHESWVRGLAFDPAGKWLISGDYHGRVLWWPIDDDKPKPIRSIEAHNGWVRAVAVSPDGKLLASCGNDQLVKLWSVEDGKPVRVLSGHTCHVYNVAFHPNGRDLASADLKGFVKHWDVEKGSEVRQLDATILHKYDKTFRADHGGIRSMAFSPDGTYLACAGITNVSNAFAGIGNALIPCFNWKTGKDHQHFRPKPDFNGTAWGAAFHPAGYLIGAGGGNGGAIWFWKLDQPLAIHAMALPANARDLSLHPDGTRLAICQVDGAVRVFEMTPREALAGKPA